MGNNITKPPQNRCPHTRDMWTSSDSNADDECSPNDTEEGTMSWTRDTLDTMDTITILSNESSEWFITPTIASSVMPMIRVVPRALTHTFWWISSGVRHLFVGQEYDKHKVSDAIEKLKANLTFLDEKMTSLNHNIEKYRNEAKRLYACRNTSAAIHQLRLKKMYEREVSKMDSLKFNIESNILHMESVGVMMETVSTIKETSHQFQIVSRHVDIDKLEDSIEEMFEQRDTSKDIENILNDMHDSHDYDEQDLMQELESLMHEDTHHHPPSHHTLEPTTRNTTSNPTSVSHLPPQVSTTTTTTTPTTTPALLLTMPEVPSNAILGYEDTQCAEEPLSVSDESTSTTESTQVSPLSKTNKNATRMATLE